MMLGHHILRTPLIPYRGHAASTKIFLKSENLQVFGSYKIRGVASAVSTASKSQLRRGLVTVSAGNMAQAVAFAAQELKIPCKIFVPDSAPEIKKTAIVKLGAEVIEKPFFEIWNLVKKGAPRLRDGLFIHPVFTPGILDGYGSIAREIAEDLSDVDAVVIPFGVGGLTLGIARVLKKLRPKAKIYACEPSTASPLYHSLQVGYPTTVARQPSFIDAIGTPEVLPEVFEEAKGVVTESIVVSPHEAMVVLRELLNGHKLLCEGAAAVSLAAAIKLSEKGAHKNIVSVLSGGNISLDTLMSYSLASEKTQDELKSDSSQ